MLCLSEGSKYCLEGPCANTCSAAWEQPCGLLKSRNCDRPPLVGKRRMVTSQRVTRCLARRADGADVSFETCLRMLACDSCLLFVSQQGSSITTCAETASQRTVQLKIPDA